MKTNQRTSIGRRSDLPLGKPVAYPERYDPSVLRAIDRAPARRRIGIDAGLPFFGEDVWNGYELSWLLPSGLPRIGVLTLRVPCNSPATVESKSLKLYLNSFAQTAFARREDVANVIAADLAGTIGCSGIVGCRISADIGPATATAATDFESFCLDDEQPCTTEPTLAATDDMGADAVHTHLFRSVCPVTGQPDWGSVQIAWRGRRIQRSTLLAYLLSYRTEASFHEDVIERIFVDVLRAAAATELTVHGRFLRRGGIDINPFRSTGQRQAPLIRLPRQ